MKKIKCLSEIDYNNTDSIVFNATVLSVISEGDGDKKPFKVNLKLEDSGEIISVCSWKFENLDLIKALVHSLEVYEFEGFANLYKNTEKQIRVGNIRNTGTLSTKKILKSVDSYKMKSELENIFKSYINKQNPFYEIISKIVFQNEKFWIWPAATKMHHAYKSGLAKHTLNVCKNVISLWKTYEGSNLNIENMVASAILHDIGKIGEYNEDGTRTIYGNFIPHPIIGYQRVFKAALELGINPETDMNTVAVLHSILTHHEKLEFGAATKPYTIEAILVARADALDAAFESADDILNNLEKNTESDKIGGLDGSKIFKWHE